MRQRFKNVVGIDINTSNVERLKRLGYDNIYIASAETFELQQQFDTIIAGELIEHLANPGLFLQQARKHLAPNGRIVITTPYPAWRYKLFVRFVMLFRNFLPKRLRCNTMLFVFEKM